MVTYLQYMVMVGWCGETCGPGTRPHAKRMLTNNYYFIIICLSVVWKFPIAISTASALSFPPLNLSALVPYVYLSVWQLVCMTFTDTRTHTHTTRYRYRWRYFLHSYARQRQLSSDRLPRLVCLLCLTAICNTIHVLLLIILLLFFFVLFGPKSSHATHSANRNFSRLKLTKANRAGSVAGSKQTLTVANQALKYLPQFHFFPISSELVIVAKYLMKFSGLSSWLLLIKWLSVGPLTGLPSDKQYFSMGF